MNVLVVTETIGSDLRFIMIAKTGLINMISPVITKEGYALNKFGNPNSLFGMDCADFTGKLRESLNLTVAHCDSGNLKKWENNDGNN